MKRKSVLEQAKFPWWFRLGVPLAEFRQPVSQQELFLTFDDGPTKSVTSEILSRLAEYNARATFFCLGSGVRQYADRYEELLASGHSIGNHSDSHCNGWQTSTRDYLRDVQAAQETLNQHTQFETQLFRPPYGRLSWLQMMNLRRQFRIIMWDVMGMDYREDLTAEEVAENVIKHASPGSIILLHDSEKAATRVLPALTRILQHFDTAGFKFRALSDGRLIQPNPPQQ